MTNGEKHTRTRTQLSDVDHATLLYRIEVLEEKYEESYALLKEIHETVTKQTGFIAGIIFIVSVVVTLFTLLKDWIFKVLGE